MAMKQSKRVETIDVGISKLPEDVRCLIMTFLPLREAVRTSILSHKWRYLWKSSMKFSRCICLDFFAMKFDSGTERSSIYNYLVFWRKGRLRNERMKFLQWTDEVMQLGSSSVIDSFRFRFYMRKKSTRRINQYINIAFAKRVKDLDIDLSPFSTTTDDSLDDTLYIFPYHLLTKEICSLIKRLSLKFCNFQPPGCHLFSVLIEVQLKMVPIGDDNMLQFLSICPNLEKLVLVDCSGLHSFIISGQSPKMKYLTISRCFLKKIRIDAKNLIRFEYVGFGSPLSFSFPNTPQLSDVTYDFGEGPPSAQTLEKFSQDLPNLESLFILVEPYKGDEFPRWLPSLFANLKKLVVMVNEVVDFLWGFIPLIQASSYIEIFELHLIDTAEFCETVERPLSSPHLHLKEITLTGFRGKCHELEFMTSLVNTSPALEKLTIVYHPLSYKYDRGLYISGRSWYTDHEWEVELARVSLEIKEMEVRVLNQFPNGVPSGVQIVFI